MPPLSLPADGDDLFIVSKDPKRLVAFAREFLAALEAEKLLLGIEVFEALSSELKAGTREAKFPVALCSKSAAP